MNDAREPSSADPERLAEAILGGARLSSRGLRKLHGGRTNHVYAANDRWVVRFSYGRAAAWRLGAELSLARDLGDINVRRCVGHGVLSGYTFQILEYIPGETLAEAWPGLTKGERHRVIGELTAVLKRMHDVTLRDFGYRCYTDCRYATWRDFLLGELAGIRSALSSLDPRGDVAKVVREVEHWAARAVRQLGEPAPSLLHNDLMPTNVLVRDGALQGVIDFELALTGCHAAELYKIDAFCRTPEAFGFCGDFTDVLPRLRAAYPELFSTPKLDLWVDASELLSTWNGYLYEYRLLGEPPEAATSIARSLAVMNGDRTRLWE
jgi:aminoglycoside phosphotransferase (APT) family kinase protein